MLSLVLPINLPTPNATNRASKTKYTCPTCGQNAWARPGARLLCGSCELPMAPPAPDPAGRQA